MGENMQRVVSDIRWEKAQVYERGFWSRQASQSSGEASQFEWYEDRARRIWEQARPLLGGRDAVSVLEIGPGPVGLVNYIEADERHALDPLEDYYCTQPDFVRARDRNVMRHNGTGEDILSLNKAFSFIILDNVLDHMKDPCRVLRGIHRSLEGRGIMFISLNIYTRFGALLRDAMECLQIDKGHPSTFRSLIVSLLENNAFKVVLSEMEDYRTQKKMYMRSGQPRKVLKSALGVVDFRFSAFCRKV